VRLRHAGINRSDLNDVSTRPFSAALRAHAPLARRGSSFRLRGYGLFISCVLPSKKNATPHLSVSNGKANSSALRRPSDSWRILAILHRARSRCRKCRFRFASSLQTRYGDVMNNFTTSMLVSHPPALRTKQLLRQPTPSIARLAFFPRADASTRSVRTTRRSAHNHGNAAWLRSSAALLLPVLESRNVDERVGGNGRANRDDPLAGC
jgi:hypothetical protein